MSTWLHDPEAFGACTIVAEVAQAHDGSVGMAHAFIDAAARAGADAVKFQTHIADAESTPSEPWRTRFSSQDATRLEYWRRMEFSESAWLELASHARERDLLFLSSPFSLEAVGLLARVGVACMKIASGELAHHALIEAAAKTGLPVVLSTGMSPQDEIDRAVEIVGRQGVPLAVLECTSLYPCPPEQVGLNLIPVFRERYGCAVGLSDHSATIFPAIAAATVGIEMIEVHLTLSREMFGPDVVASLVPDELRELARGVRFVEAMNASPVTKATLPETATGLRAIFMRSVVATQPLAAGTRLERSHLAAKKPGTGIAANELEGLVGRRLRCAVERDQLLDWDDLED